MHTGKVKLTWGGWSGTTTSQEGRRIVGFLFIKSHYSFLPQRWALLVYFLLLMYSFINCFISDFRGVPCYNFSYISYNWSSIHFQWDIMAYSKMNRSYDLVQWVLICTCLSNRHSPFIKSIVITKIPLCLFLVPPYSHKKMIF